MSRLGPDTCQTLEQSLSAIKLGKRQWDTNVTNNNPHPGAFPSTFAPYECQLPWQSADQLCEIMDVFDTVILYGDSLSRHIQGALITALQNDFIAGFIKGSPNSLAESYCQCDGQFSEKEECRSMSSSFHSIQASTMCLNLQIPPLFQEYFTEKRYSWEFDFEWLHKCQETAPQKGILLILQGGLNKKARP